MTTTFDFTKSVLPIAGPSKSKSPYHPRVEQPGAIDKKRGLVYPLTSGAMAMESRDIITDRAGSLSITFTLDELPDSVALIHAFGQYPPVVKLEATHLILNAYHHNLELLVPWKKNHKYTLDLSWDHTTGITLSLTSKDAGKQTMQRNWTWQAFDQKYVIFAVGGFFLGRPVFTNWQGSLKGSVSKLSVTDEPMVPVKPAKPVRDCRGRSPLASHKDVKLLAINDPPLVDSKLRYCHVPERIDDLKKTRKKWQLDKLIDGARDELAVFARVTHMVGHAWPHYHYWPWPRGEQRHIFWKSGHEMHDPIKAGEFGGMCGGYAHVMEELFWSLGYEARRIQVFGHSSFEAYSNQLGKWVICDASLNRQAHIMLDAHDNPIGVKDMIEKHEALEDNPNALDGVHLGVCQKDGTLKNEEATWLSCYRYAGVRLVDTAVERGGGPHAWYFSPWDRSYCRDATLNCGGPVSHVKKIDDLFWSCQRADVALKWKAPGKSVAVNCTPFNVAHADGFEYEIDQAEDWQRTRGKFTWTLHAGVNHLRVRTTNKLNAKGHPWGITVWRRP